MDSLAAGSVACGDIVSYLTQVTIDADAVGTQMITFDYTFAVEGTSGNRAGHIDVTGLAMNYASSAGEGPGGLDSGINDDGGSSISGVIEGYDAAGDNPPGSTYPATAEELNLMFDLDDLEAGESVVFRIDVLLACDAGSGSGLVQATQNGVSLGSQSVPGGGETAQPPVTTAQPPVTTAQPPVMTAQPPVMTAQPPVMTAQPPVMTAQPPVMTAQPPVMTAQPPVMTAQPPVMTAQPPVMTAQPPVMTAQPPVMTAQPPVMTAQPPVTTAQPPVTTAQPPVTTAQPPVTTAQPPVTTAQPPVTTAQPPVTTTTQAPATTTTLLASTDTLPVTGVGDVLRLSAPAGLGFLLAGVLTLAGAGFVGDRRRRV